MCSAVQPPAKRALLPCIFCGQAAGLIRQMLKVVDFQTNVYAPLFFARLRIVADVSPELYLSQLRSSFKTFSEDPVSSITGRFEGNADNSRFRFHRVEWFSGRVNPRCSGTVSRLSSGKVLIAATVQAVPLFFVLAMFVLFSIVLFRGSLLAIIASLTIVAIFVLRNTLSVRSGYQEIESLLLKTVEES
jgi:hypothetical protein